MLQLANILDYINWRGDIPFSSDPFNSVDGLILAQLAYLPLRGVVSTDFSIRMKMPHVYEHFDPDKVPESAKFFSFDHDCILLQKLAESPRFSGTQLTGYIDETKPEQELQFSAITCILEDGTVFISYRGTDGTVVGWKEDFNLGVVQQTGAQLYAVNYLNQHFTNFPRQLRIGGHSKGGNLAVYASAFCKPEIRPQILAVYSYDAPGFREEIVNTEEYKSILPKIKSIIPESSVVGLLLANSMEHTIIKSQSSGIKQHFAYSWEVLRNEFVRAEELSESSALIQKALSGWLADFSDEERKIFVDSVFEVINAPEKGTFKEINQNKRSSYLAMLKAVGKLPPDRQAILIDAFKKIAKNAVS